MYTLSKRLIDIFLSVVLLILFSPLFLIISLVILIESGLPVFFNQERVGKDWRKFHIFKFRTMVKNADKLGPAISIFQDKRVTPVGRILRKYKLDELPQLFNVLMGDMSIVGPRPEVMKYVNIYKKDYSNILKIKPGISDYASIQFYDEASFLKPVHNAEDYYKSSILPQKIKLYNKYIDEMSLTTDFKIIFKTVKTIIR